MKPVDLVASQMDEATQRREDAWAAMKKAHDEANGIFPLVADGGWCAPSEVIYDSIAITSESGLIELGKVAASKGVRFR